MSIKPAEQPEHKEYNYIIGNYWDIEKNNCISAYTHGSTVFHGSLEQAQIFADSLSKQNNETYRVFLIDEQPIKEIKDNSITELDWVILLNNTVFTDSLESPEVCKTLIKEYKTEFTGDFTYRRMTQSEEDARWIQK